MVIELIRNGKRYTADLNRPIDLSIELEGGANNLTAWYQGPPVITPVKSDDFIGDVRQGGSVNFRDIYFNPHAHGTHTECVGHISAEEVNINQVLKAEFLVARLITVDPKELSNGDLVVQASQLPDLSNDIPLQALIVRTLPNSEQKKHQQYSHTNPPYVDKAVMEKCLEAGIDHFLIDLPSVDREEDEGKLESHKAFWNYPEELNKSRTITEFIYAGHEVQDGLYLLTIHMANFKNDASPSRPIIYSLNHQP